MGYCIGGTLLAMTLAWLAAKGDKPFRPATFMVSLQDFSQVGDTAVFMDEAAIDFIEQQMMERGYLDSREMSNMFNLLRSNDLIWANVVNNYLMGNKPPAFDLLYWNSDGTRMARAAHSWYLRNTYVENNLIKPGKVKLKGEPIDLGRIEPGHLRRGRGEGPHRALGRGLADHPAVRRQGALRAGLQRPHRRHHQPAGRQGHLLDQRGAGRASPDAWRDAATKHDGSWWTDWSAWLSERSGDKVKPPAHGQQEAPAARRRARGPTCWRSRSSAARARASRLRRPLAFARSASHSGRG